MTATQRANRRRSNGMAALRQQAAVVGKDVRTMAETAGETLMGQFDPVENYVREKPIRSLLIAAGVGCVLGLILLRR